jgi:hypothetical protein
MITTTTFSDSDEPTIVPIVVPIGKPPVICWSCVSIPGKAQIKVADFCVNIIGSSIGNCPPNEKGNDQEDEDDEDEEEEKETSSCSTTITATYASVFCTITRNAQGSDDVHQKREEGCSTLEYSTITACETAAASTTTTTTTIEPSAI